MFGLLLKHLELGFPGIGRRIERQQIGQQTFQRQMLLERFEQDVFGALGLHRRIEHFFLGGEVLGQVVADARQRCRARLRFARLDRRLHLGFELAVLVDQKFYRIHVGVHRLGVGHAVCTTAAWPRTTLH